MEQTNKQMKLYLQSIERKGYSRRDFMKFRGFYWRLYGRESIASRASWQNHWLQLPDCLLFGSIFKKCTCCSESFIRSDHPIVADIILDKISLDYTLTLMAASGH